MNNLHTDREDCECAKCHNARVEKLIEEGAVVSIRQMFEAEATDRTVKKSVESMIGAEDRLKIAARIVELSNQILSTVARKHHIALKMEIGTGPYSNAVIVSDSYVKFYIRSEDLLKKAMEEGFTPELVKWTGPWAGFGYRFRGLGLNDIQAHEGFFRTVVQESMNEIEYRNGQGKKR